ncbi:MAG: hypothetical protein ACYTBJ_10125 [Planctomycetota bacterium]|jgi:hypothetical protein
MKGDSNSVKKLKIRGIFTKSCDLVVFLTKKSTRRDSPKAGAASPEKDGILSQPLL